MQTLIFHSLLNFNFTLCGTLFRFYNWRFFFCFWHWSYAISHPCRYVDLLSSCTTWSNIIDLYISIRMWDTIFFLKVAFCCYQRPQAAPWPKTGVFHSRSCPYAKLLIYFGNQVVIGVVSLPVDKWLEEGPQITVLCRDIQ